MMSQVTKDVCATAYPPEVYGKTLSEVEATIQEVVERVFRDEDGMIRSGVHGKTMRPLELHEVTDRPYGIGCCSENHHIPNDIKPLFMNYENAGQCSGKYIVAMLEKYAATGDPEALSNARRTVSAIQLLWDNVAEQNEYPGGRGWMPKPFDGIRNVSLMTECSPDQYTDMTLGLQRFHDEAADEQERAAIEEMIVSFADWWSRHDYATSYEGGTCWWKLRPDCIHAVSFFLYLNSLANSFRPNEKYDRDFEMWLKILDESLAIREGMTGANMLGLVTECMERLIVLRPDLKELWLNAITNEEPEGLIRRVLIEDQDVPGLKYQQLNAFAARYLCAASRVFNKPVFEERAEELISEYSNRGDFYHVSRGMPVDKLPPEVRGDDYRDIFWAEGHICWLTAYWMIRNSDLRRER
jgi:hypothetical protein